MACNELAVNSDDHSLADINSAETIDAWRLTATLDMESLTADEP